MKRSLPTALIFGACAIAIAMACGTSVILAAVIGTATAAIVCALLDRL